MTTKADTTYKNIETMQTYGIDIINRELYLTGEDIQADNNVEPGVEHLMSTKFIKNIRFLASQNNNSILIHMKTCGGDYIEGMAIYDAILNCPCYVAILSYSHARSMSSIILQAADRRVLMPNSYMMIHYGTVSYYGLSQEVKTQYEWDRQYNENMLDIYVARMIQKGTFKGNNDIGIKNYLRGKIKDTTDVFFTPEESVELGLADEIFNGIWEKLK